MEKLKILTTSFFKAMLVSINTILPQKGYVIGILLVAFNISFIWCYKVSKIALYGFKNKLIYSFGDGIGSVTGFLIMKII